MPRGPPDSTVVCSTCLIHLRHVCDKGLDFLLIYFINELIISKLLFSLFYDYCYSCLDLIYFLIVRNWFVFLIYRSFYIIYIYHYLFIFIWPQVYQTRLWQNLTNPAWSGLQIQNVNLPAGGGQNLINLALPVSSGPTRPSLQIRAKSD